ncbi:MAG: hypothetical protein WA110_01390 [Anaerolineaceae bacterium]
MLWIELKTIVVILLMLLLPGWAILAVSGFWKRWEPLQRWFLAVCFGVAFYPVLYYSARFLLPGLRIGDTKLVLLLFVCAGLIMWKLHKDWKEQFQFGQWGWVVLGVLAATLFTRLILAHQYPYLAGDDSLHHTLLTELTATTGKLPYTLEPYDSTSLNDYHLGLYALTAPLSLLAGIPSDRALLWMSQFLSGICGVGVFLFLDRKVSRLAGVAGMVMAGLLSPFPSWYINWGRFTQLSAQTILLPAVLVTWEVLSPHGKSSGEKKYRRYVYLILAGLLNAGVCLLHFRVAGFMLPLTLIICVVALITSRKQGKKSLQTLVNVIIIAAITLVIILPTLIPGLTAYLDKRVRDGTTSESEPRPTLASQSYYSDGEKTAVQISKESIPLFGIGAAGLVFGLILKKHRMLSAITLFWVIMLMVEAYAYLLNVYALAFTNITAVLLMLYLPLSLAFGILTDSLLWFSSKRNLAASENFIIFLVLLAGFVGSYYRINEYEEQRAYMTPEDQKAMEWVKENTPSDAVFAVNTSFLNPSMPFGVDAGYWLPYYGQRKTTTLTLLASLSEENDAELIRAESVLTLYEPEPDLEQVCQNGIDYIYASPKQTRTRQFDMDTLAQLPGTNMVYDQDGVRILQICE